MPVKNEETYKKIIDTSNNNDYTTGKLLGFAYFKENYRLIAVDLSKQAKLKDPQQVSFIGKLLNRHGVTMFFIEKSRETTFNFSQNPVTIIDMEQKYFLSLKKQKKLLLIFYKILSQSYK